MYGWILLYILTTNCHGRLHDHGIHRYDAGNIFNVFRLSIDSVQNTGLNCMICCIQKAV